MKKYKVGLIGCGAISGNYIHHAKKVYYDYFEIAALGDIDLSKANEYDEKHEIKRWGAPVNRSSKNGQ